MDIKKTLFVILASTGLVIPSLHAAEYSQSISGNVRVEAIAKTVDDVETLTTTFGGDEEESTTGGDTNLQWNHALVGEHAQGSAFLRFSSDGVVRYNVAASGEKNSFSAAVKAEWETIDGFSGDVTERDQFAVLSHASGVYYKIGREEWFDGVKGYTSDFLSQTKSLARTQANSPRFAAHAIGWSGSGINVALLLQRDSNVGSSTRSLFGDNRYRPEATLSQARIDQINQENTDPNFNITSVIERELARLAAAVALGRTQGINVTVNAADVAAIQEATALDEAAAAAAISAEEAAITTDVNSYGVQFGYAAGPVDLKVNYATGTQETNTNRDTTSAKSEGTVTQVYLGFPVGVATPFVNYGSQTRTVESAGSTTSEYTRAGWNLGVDLNFANSVLVLAYGSDSEEDKSVTDSGETTNAYDVIWATTTDPLFVSLAYSSGTKNFDNSEKENVVTNQYGVRMEYGF